MAEKRWTLAKADEIEALRGKRRGRGTRLLKAVSCSVLFTGPLVACNPKGTITPPVPWTGGTAQTGDTAVSTGDTGATATGDTGKQDTGTSTGDTGSNGG